MSWQKRCGCQGLKFVGYTCEISTYYLYVCVLQDGPRELTWGGMGVQVATLRSAVKLEQEQQFLIAKKLQELTGSKNIKLKPVIDEELIAGFVVEYGSSQVRHPDSTSKSVLHPAQMNHTLSSR